MEEAVAGERQLGEDEQVDALGARPLDPFQVVADVALEIAEPIVNLRETHPNP